MSVGSSIDVSKVKQFGSNIYHLSQQKESRLRPYVRFETLNAEAGFYDRLGETEMYEKVGRHSDTKFADIEWSRRRVTMRDWAWAHPIDKEDKLRLIHNPESEVAKAARYAAGRKMDTIIIENALGNAYAGKDGSTSVSLPNTQKVGATDGSAFTKLSLETLRIIREKFWANEALASRDDMIHLVCRGTDIMNLLRDTNVTSSDYNTVKALVNGDIKSYMGFMFHKIEFMPELASSISFDPVDGSVGAGGGTLAIGSSRNLAFTTDGLLMAMGQDIVSRVDERPDKNYLNQVYLKFTMGGVRMEEKKVVEVICKA